MYSSAQEGTAVWPLEQIVLESEQKQVCGWIDGASVQHVVPFTLSASQVMEDG
jgi:hypothetical protein